MAMYTKKSRFKLAQKLTQEGLEYAVMYDGKQIFSTPVLSEAVKKLAKEEKAHEAWIESLMMA